MSKYRMMVALLLATSVLSHSCGPTDNRGRKEVRLDLVGIWLEMSNHGGSNCFELQEDGSFTARLTGTGVDTRYQGPWSVKEDLLEMDYGKGSKWYRIESVSENELRLWVASDGYGRFTGNKNVLDRFARLNAQRQYADPAHAKEARNRR